MRWCIATAAAVVAASLGVGPADAAPTPDPTVASGYGWGAGNDGQLGSGTTAQALNPIPVQYPAGTTKVAGGGEFTLALTPAGVFAWGRGTEGQLGNGGSTSSLTAVPVSFPAGTVITDIAADDGHSLALTDDGRVFAWGRNGDGQLGDGTTIDRSTPVEVTLPVPVPVAAIGTGRAHSLAALTTGELYAWGANAHGQLGDGTTTPSAVPVAIPVPGGLGVVQVAGGDEHSIALTTTNQVYVWGDGSSGQLANGTYASSLVPVLAAGVSAISVHAGSRSNVVLVPDGGVLSWGGNEHGQLGDGTTNDSASPRAVYQPFIPSLLSISGDTVIMVSEDHRSVVTWGAGASGQIGDGSTADRPLATGVALPAGEFVTAATAGHFASIVIVQQGPLSRLQLDPGVTGRRVGQSQTYAVRGFDALGHDLGELPTGITLTMTGGTCAGLTCTVSTAGEQVVTASAGDAPVVTGTARILATQDPPDTTSPTTSATTTPPDTAPDTTAPVATVVASIPGSVAPPSPTTSPPPPSIPGGTLPSTGGNALPIVGFAAVLLASGVALTLTRVRRAAADRSQTGPQQ
jgi:alpha-tubulin suppressor-like RCC1 family protein